MRITSGKARGISLDSPRGDGTRPATDAARLAIFSSLGDAAEGAQVLDLFAGTGAYGLEALSRGAASAIFVESDRRAHACMLKNTAAVLKCIEKSSGETPAATPLCMDCFKAANTLSEKTFDIVFADPPYAMLLEADTLKKILGLFGALSKPETIFVLEAPAQFELPETFDGKWAFNIFKRLGKTSKGKPSQLIFKISKI